MWLEHFTNGVLGKPSSDRSDSIWPGPRVRKAAIRTALLLSILLLAGNIGYGLLPRSLQSLIYVPLAAAIAGGLLLWARRRMGFTLASMGLATETTRTGATLGAVFGLSAGVLVLSGLLFLRGVHLSTLLSGDYAINLADPWVRVLVRIPFGTVLLEEIAFRGVLLKVIRSSGVGILKAIILSSVVFGLWHVGALVPILSNFSLSGLIGGIGAFAGVPVAFLGGILFAALRIRTGNIAAPMVAHWLVNASATFAFVALIAPIG